MTLRRSDIADPAVAVLVIVPTYEAHRPLPGSVKIGESLSGELGSVSNQAKRLLVPGGHNYDLSG
jgi:hypothetical protein